MEGPKTRPLIHLQMVRQFGKRFESMILETAGTNKPLLKVQIPRHPSCAIRGVQESVWDGVISIVCDRTEAKSMKPENSQF